MNLFRKCTFVMFAVCIIFSAAGAVSAAEGKPEGEPIKIGYIATLTGDGATWGQDERDGALLASKMFNAKGGVLGRPLELICYDIKGKPEEAVLAVRRLIYEDKVVAIGGSNYSSIQMAITPIANKGQVPVIATAATNPAVTVDPATGKVHPYMFRIGYIDPYQGKIIADYLIKKCGAKKLAIVGDVGDPYSEGLTEFIQKRAAELNVETKFWGFRSGDVDFRAQITAAREWGADAVALTMLYKEMGLLIKQAAELNWKPFFMGGDGYSPNIYEIGGAALEGAFWVYSMSEHDPILAPIKEMFLKEYGREATEVGNVTLSYDLIQMFVHAIEKAGKAEGPAIRDEIENTENFQVTHFNWTVDKATHNPLNKPAAIIQAQGGKSVFIEKWEPQDN